MDEFMPIPSFYFSVELDGVAVHFQEVSGLEVSMEVEEITEGGNNLYKHRVPTRQSYSNITLARGVMSEDNPFYLWVQAVLLKQETLNNTFGKLTNVLSIYLMSPSDNEIIKSWQIIGAYPIKWSVSNLNATENKIAIETVDLAFQYLESID